MTESPSPSPLASQHCRASPPPNHAPCRSLVPSLCPSRSPQGITPGAGVFPSLPLDTPRLYFLLKTTQSEYPPRLVSSSRDEQKCICLSRSLVRSPWGAGEGPVGPRCCDPSLALSKAPRKSSRFGGGRGGACSLPCTPHGHPGLSLALTKLDLVLGYFYCAQRPRLPLYSDGAQNDR